jgi:6-phosphofructokinase 1
MHIGVLTGGGDCPGLNAVIRGVVRRAENRFGYRVTGFLDGWRGVIENDTMDLTIESCRGILPRGGTILGTSRITPYQREGDLNRAKTTLGNLNVDALVVIGGEGTLSCARQAHDDGLRVIGVPKTIDNDVGGTEMTFGFDTAVHIASAAIDRLHTTAESHDRVMVVEVMGRHVGHIAIRSGLAGGATMTLIPERPFDIGAVCDSLTRRHQAGRYASIVVVAEGAKPKEGTMDLAEQVIDEYGHVKLGGISNRIAHEIETRTGLETRVTILGYIQRGGTPTAADRVLASRFGIAAVDAVHAQEFGSMVALQSDRIVRVPLAEATASLKMVDDGIYDAASEFFA